MLGVHGAHAAVSTLKAASGVGSTFTVSVRESEKPFGEMVICFIQYV